MLTLPCCCKRDDHLGFAVVGQARWSESYRVKGLQKPNPRMITWALLW